MPGEWVRVREGAVSSVVKQAHRLLRCPGPSEDGTQRPQCDQWHPARLTRSGRPAHGRGTDGLALGAAGNPGETYSSAPLSRPRLWQPQSAYRGWPGSGERQPCGAVTPVEQPRLRCARALCCVCCLLPHSTPTTQEVGRAGGTDGRQVLASPCTGRLTPADAVLMGSKYSDCHSWE